MIERRENQRSTVEEKENPEESSTKLTPFSFDQSIDQWMFEKIMLMVSNNHVQRMILTKRIHMSIDYGG